MRRFLLLIAALLLALLPSSALAFEPRAGNDVTVGPGEVINDDLYAAGGSVNIQGTVRGDVIAAGGSITVTGQVERNVRAFGGTLLVDGPVGGDVQAGGATVRLGSGAVITGDLNYTSEREAIIAPGAQVQGTVQRQIPQPQRSTALDATVGWLRNLVGLLALGLIFALVFPRFAHRTADTIGTSPWASLGAGIGVLIVVPIVAALLFGLGALTLAAVRSRREPPPALVEPGPAPTGEPPEGRIAA